MTRVNYLLQICAFYEWLERNELSGQAIALWHALMYLWNQSYWTDKFTPAMASVIARSGQSKKTILRVRKELCEAGLIELNTLGGRELTEYKMIPFDIQIAPLHTQDKKTSGVSSKEKYRAYILKTYNQIAELNTGHKEIGDLG